MTISYHNVTHAFQSESTLVCLRTKCRRFESCWCHLSYHIEQPSVNLRCKSNSLFHKTQNTRTGSLRPDSSYRIKQKRNK